MGQWLSVEETALAGVGLLGHDDLDADKRGFVGKHRNETGMRQEDERLSVARAHADLLLPALVLPDHQRSDALGDELGDEMVHEAPTGDREIPVDLAFALVRQDVEAMRGVWPFGQEGL